MAIKKLLIKNYKSINYTVIKLNDDVNIFVGENDSGKSTILEALSIVTTGKLNGIPFDKQVKANMFNQNIRQKYKDSCENSQNVMEPPEIIIEIYLDLEDQTYAGSNNELREDCTGIRMELSLNREYAEAYKQMLIKKEIYDIPIELYSVSYRYFNSDPVIYRFSPVKAVFIDTTRKNYSNMVDRFVTDNITSYLNSQEQTDLSTAYRKSRHSFQENSVVSKLNESIKQNVRMNSKEVEIDLREDVVDEWKHQMSVMVENIPFENLGFGTQNSIKIELAIRNSKDQMNIVLMEEPENNLSYTNMAKLINHIVENGEKQVFISTHSSYIANKLDLGKLFLLQNGKIESMSDLPEATKNYFRKLPGYDTLRIILAEKVILVEGATDELIIQRAYLDEYRKLPIADGIDVIVVDSLAFKRYCDIAAMMGKKVIIVTDNDSNIQKNIIDKYVGYIGKPNLIFVYELDENLNTIEPSVLEANCVNGEPTEVFKQVISKKGSMLSKNKQEVLDFMKGNKAEWALRVFDGNEKINYPEYIKNAIKQYD